MEFLILGPVKIQEQGNVVEPQGLKQRTLLATLVIRANQVVSTPQLIEELWPVIDPGKPQNALQAHIARLRKLLKDVERAPVNKRLLSRKVGYSLRAMNDEIDAAKFSQLLAEGQRLATFDLEGAAGILRESLGLWRGPVLQETGEGLICQAAVARFQERRIRAQELLVDINLRIGRHADIVDDIEELVVINPLRENFYDQLMTALYRCGRYAEALEVYQRARERFAADLGIDPSPTLEQRMLAILNHEPDTSVGPPDTPNTPPPEPPTPTP